MIDKQLWLDLRHLDKPREEMAEVFSNVLNTSSVQTVLIQGNQYPYGHSEEIGHKIKLVCYIDNLEQFFELEGFADSFHAVISEDEGTLASVKEHTDAKTGLYVRVTDRATLDFAWMQGIHYDYLIVDFKDETNIPLELVIAQIEERRSKTVLLKVVQSIEDARIAFEVLERGSDGIILSGTSLDSLEEMDQIISHSEPVKLQEVVVDSIQYIGMGDRGCIDVAVMMTQDEGMIIGSTSSGGIFVCSETHYLPYMELRPFRVNAGGVHSYVLGPNNTTSYISELAAGRQVLCVHSNGSTRIVPVGRVKIERRPLLLIKGFIEGTEINTILQDDWHVRVMGADGKAKNITNLKKGDRLLGCLMKSGRHVGIQVTETILEK